jgi:L-threonylcarbamoyladenylate synthase
MELAIDPLTCTVVDFADAVSRLRAGGVVAFPTDTVYGLAVDPRSGAAVRALFDLKGRPGDSALPVIAGSLEQVEACFGTLDASSRALADRFWPGPLSLILPAPVGFDAAVHAGQETIAVRVPDHRVARLLAGAFGHPITATSANLSGDPPAAASGQIDAVIRAGALVIDAGPAPGGRPSTIVDARSVPPRLVRAGAVPWNRVLESLKA